ETSGEARGPDQARRIFIEGIILEDAQEFGFNISYTIEGVGQQSARTWVERERHRIDGKVAPAHVVIDGTGSDFGRFAWLVISFRARAGDLRPHVAWQQKH